MRRFLSYLSSNLMEYWEIILKAWFFESWFLIENLWNFFPLKFLRSKTRKIYFQFFFIFLEISIEKSLMLFFSKFMILNEKIFRNVFLKKKSRVSAKIMKKLKLFLDWNWREKKFCEEKISIFQQKAYLLKIFYCLFLSCIGCFLNKRSHYFFSSQVFLSKNISNPHLIFWFENDQNHVKSNFLKEIFSLESFMKHNK